ncbi:MAG: molybdopterin-dependent oxidoreductase [Treponema sp.]|jgi:CO/xanthine dehydrogenase Mo-binding subunit|nr:molybdopterin-dependent oxidoreductase [Treponema sp.]
MADIPLLQDIPFRSTLFALTIRSPVPKGRLLSIESPQLERAYTLISAADIPGNNELADFPVPILAREELSYLGEPVALLVGPDQAGLNTYARQCRVIADSETPVYAAPASCNVASGDPAPGDAAHGSTASGVAASDDAAPGDAASGDPASGAEPEVFVRRDYRRGDTDAAFAGAAQIIEGAYSTGIQEHAYSEPVGALAEYTRETGNGEAAQPLLVIRTATQWPYHVSRSAAAMLGLNQALILTEATGLGLPLDGKIWYPSLVACQAALAAFITRRNVRLLLNREEDFQYSPKRNSSVTEIRSALGEKGEILGTRIDMTVDLGAYNVFAQEILDQSCLAVMGIAGRGALELRARAIRTNIPPQGPLGGFGAAQGAFAMERHQSRIADALALDPAEWRKNNRPGKEGLAGLIPLREEAPIEQLLDTVAAMGSYYRKWASYELLRLRRRESPPGRPESLRGIGIALGWQGSGLLYPGVTACEVEVTLNIDGSLEIHTGMGAGQESGELWSGIARDILAVEDVRLVSRDTTLSPDSGPGILSRNITILSALVQKSCETIRNQRFRDPLPITVRERCEPPQNTPQTAPPPGFDSPPGIDLESRSRPGWAAAVVEVEIQDKSYIPSIRGIWLAVDGGLILSEERARRSLKLAGIQALGWTSREYLEYRDGALSPARISDYGIPNPGEIPPIHIDFLWNSATEPKGIGDLPFSCVPAAYIQAVSQAIDQCCTTIPLKPAAIWEIFRQKSREQGKTEELEP